MYKKKSTESITKSDLDRLINRRIERYAEKKYNTAYGANQTLTSCPGGGYPAYINVAPAIAQGTAINNRLGNEIRVTRAKVRIAINLLPYNAISNPNPPPVWVRVWLTSSRKLNTTTLTSTDINTAFFAYTATPLGFQASMLDIVMPNNLADWVVHQEKTFKLGVTGTNATGPASTGAWMVNSDVSHITEFDITNVLGKLRYNGGSNDPDNKNLFVVMQVVSADGTASGSQVMTEYHFSTQVEYTDA